MALSSAEVEGRVRALLIARIEDRELLRRFEALAAEARFGVGALTPLWGPALYARNRPLFRQLVLSHAATHTFTRWGWTPIRWRGPREAELEVWLEAADRADDVEVFRLLYAWKLAGKRGFDVERWRRDLRERLAHATSRAARSVVLSKLEIPGGVLDEATAIDLYGVDPVAAGPFILRHLPWGREKPWRRLWALAEERRDDTLYFELYRAQVPFDEWEEAALELAARVADPGELNQALEQRHPTLRGKTGGTLAKLLERRGRDVFPYVVPRLREVYGGWFGDRSGYQALVRVAEERGWVDLWGHLVRTSASESEYHKVVESLVRDRARPEAELLERMLLLSGMVREWSAGPFGVVQIRPLGDDLAVTLYDRWPELLRGPMKPQIAPSWGQWYPKLLDRLLTAGDTELVDYLASRILTRAPRSSSEEAIIERLAEHYRGLEDETERARRAARVVGLVPPFVISSLKRLVEENKLARLLYLRSSSSYLADAAAIRDLLEAPQIHTQALGFRALALDDPRARALGAANLDLLTAALLRPLHRRTRRLACDALHQATHAEDAAAKVLAKAREALDLPDARYPKEELVGLMGHILHRFPGLRAPGEAPVVYRRSRS